MAIFNKRVPTFFYELLNKPLEEVKKILGIGQQTFTDTNITEGTLNTATTNRTVDLGNFDLSIEGSGDRKIYLSSLGSEINHLIVNRVGSTVSPTFHNRLETTPNLIKLDSRNGGSFGEISINNTNLNVTLYSSLGNYRIGINNSTIPPIFPSTTSPHVLSLNPNNGVMYTTDTSSYFISDSALAPASTGSPTFTEVETYIAGLGAAVTPTLKNRVLYYTGTNTSTDAYTHSYLYSGNGKLYELGGSSFEDPLIVTSTNLNTNLNTVNSPTTNQVLTYLNSQNGVSAYRNRYVLYDRNGNNFITKVFYVTNDDRILIVHDPNPVRYITVNISYPMIDTNLDNKIIGSVAIPQDLHVNGNYQIQQIKYNCVVNGTGTNTVPITVNDAGGYVTDFTVNAAFGGGQNNLGGVFLDSSDGRVLFFEAGTVTGAIEHLSITLTLV